MTWRSDSCGHLELVKSLKAGWMAGWLTGCNTGGNIIIILVWLVVGGGTNVWQLRTQDWCSSSLQSLLEVIEQWLHPRVMTPTNWRFIYFDNFISMDWLSTVANTTGNALSDWLTISSTLTNSWLPEFVVYFWLFLTQSWYRSRPGLGDCCEADIMYLSSRFISRVFSQ